MTCDSRGRTAQGPSNATTLAFRQTAGDEVVLGVCKPLIRRVRSAGVKTTVHRCDSLLMCVLFSAHQAAGSHNAQAFRTPFRGVPRQRFGVAISERKPVKLKWRALEPINLGR